jgi:hypothetical protein
MNFLGFLISFCDRVLGGTTAGTTGTLAMGNTEDPDRDPEEDPPAPGAGVPEDCAQEAALSGAAGAGYDPKTDAWGPADQAGEPLVPAPCTEEDCVMVSRPDCASATAPMIGIFVPPDGAVGEASAESFGTG